MRVCTLHKVCERQGEATRVQGFKRFHKALRWPIRNNVLFCDCSSSTQGHGGGWSQSRLSLGEGWAAAWTSRQFIARLHRTTNSYLHLCKSVANLELPGCIRFLFSHLGIERLENLCYRLRWSQSTKCFAELVKRTQWRSFFFGVGQ